MKKSPQYLGFLSFLSLIYFVTWNTTFLVFIAFALYFTSRKKIDERLQKNIGLATRNAFVYVVLVGIMSLVYIDLVQDNSIFPLAFTLLFSGSIIVHVISYFFYNFKEERQFRKEGP